MTNGFDPKRLEQLITRLDEVAAEARIIREEVSRAIDRNSHHQAAHSPATALRPKSEKRRAR